MKPKQIKIKTALQEFLDYLEKYEIYPIETIKNAFLETEKQQIIDAYSDGQEYGFNKFGQDSEKYYNETFKN